MPNSFNDLTAAEQHKAEIENSRRGGFGGSDAQLFLNIAHKSLSKISQTDLKRISIALGYSEYVPSPDNKYTLAGHAFEDWMDRSIFSHRGDIERETLIEQHIADNFRTFAHADFTAHYSKVVYELKYVQKDDEQVLKHYMPQLQWYYMLGAENVQLVHGQGDVEPFAVKTETMIEVQRDEEMINSLRAGIILLDEAIKDGWKPVLRDERLVPFDLKLDFDEYIETVQQIKELTEKADALKAKLKDYMEENKVAKMSGDYMGDTFYCSFSEASQTRSFDSKKFLDKHPEFNLAEFYKTTEKKSYITIR